jgi:hypothetical protein
MKSRVGFKVVLAFIGVSAVLSFALAAWLNWTESGKDWVKGRIEQVVTKNIPGKLRIGRIVDIGPPLIAKDVRFYHPDGRAVLIADSAEVVPDLGEALRGRLGFERAAVDGGRIILSPDPDGRIAIEAALDKKSRPGEPSDPHGGLHYALQSMHVQNYRVDCKLSDLADFRLDDVKGFVGVRRIESSGTQVILDSVSGRVSPGFLGKRTELEKVDGWVHGKEKHTAQLTAALRIGKGELTSKVDVFDRDKAPVSIKIEKARGEGDFAKELMEFADSLFGDTLQVKSED